MSDSSSVGYIYYFKNLMQGKLNTRTINGFAIDFFLKNIYNDYGKTGLTKALLSLSQHLDYYEDKSGANIHEGREIYKRYLKEIQTKQDIDIVYADEVSPAHKYAEGKTRVVLVNNYERNQIARKKCIDHFGLNCQCCGFSFKQKYGELGCDFIHVHHLIDISTIGNEYSVDPINDLIPVCPNCHSMLHKRKPAYSIDELKQLIN